jgi:hypothetical protein
MKSIILWDLTPCSLVDDRWRYGKKHYLQLKFRRISEACNQEETNVLTYTSTINMEAVRVSETSVNFMSQNMVLLRTV